MKWIIGILVVVNVLIFALARLGQDSQSASPNRLAAIENVPTIKLLSSSETRNTGRCTNLGPIEQQIVLDRFTQVLNQQSFSFKVISESEQLISAYRVIINQTQDSELTRLKEQLKSMDVSEIYEKQSESGERYLSLGVFTYEKTAKDFAANLVSAGFDAEFRNEFLRYPQRHWLNISQPLDETVIAELNNYIGPNKLSQLPARCL